MNCICFLFVSIVICGEGDELNLSNTLCAVRLTSAVLSFYMHQALYLNESAIIIIINIYFIAVSHAVLHLTIIKCIA